MNKTAFSLHKVALREKKITLRDREPLTNLLPWFQLGAEINGTHLENTGGNCFSHGKMIQFSLIKCQY